VILFQPENEYYDCLESVTPCPNHDYMQKVEDQFRDAGIVVPYIVNVSYCRFKLEEMLLMKNRTTTMATSDLAPKLQWIFMESTATHLASIAPTLTLGRLMHCKLTSRRLIKNGAL
jgi:hypothetical protein